MTVHQISDRELKQFLDYMTKNEYAPGTVDKYMRDIRHFRRWLSDRTVTKQSVLEWKEHLLKERYAPVTINAMLAALNCFFKVVGWQSLRVKELRIQRRMFRSSERNLNKEEYMRLLEVSRATGKERLALLMETICATGIRVSEVRYITMEAVTCGRTEVHLKGKIRTILIPNKMCRKLLKYAKKTKDCFRQDISYQKRERHFKTTDLGRNEGNVWTCGDRGD